MPIIGIEGGIGAGKTLVMTKLLHDEAVGLQKPVYSNYWLAFDHMPLKIHGLIAQAANPDGGLSASALAVDEAHIWMDSRMSQKKRSLVLSYFILQTGKIDVNLYYTTQNFGQVDKRLRQRTDVAITVERKGKWHLCHVIPQDPKSNPYRFRVFGPSYYQMYRTRQVVQMPD